MFIPRNKPNPIWPVEEILLEFFLERLPQIILCHSVIKPLVVEDIVHKSENKISLFGRNFGIKNGVCHDRTSERKKWGNNLRNLFISRRINIFVKK